MSNIFELSADFLQIRDMMDDPELDPKTLADTMEGVEGELEEKFDSYVYVAKMIIADIGALDLTIDQLTERKKALEKNLKKLKDNMTLVMKETGKTKFKTPFHSYWVQANPKSVVIDAGSVRDIPEDYLNYKDPEPSKSKMAEAMENGVDLSGIAHFEQTEGVRWR